MTPEMKTEIGLVSVPLSMSLGNKEYLDDDYLNINDFMAAMKSFTGKPSSASPPPFLYQEAIEAADDSYIVTLSSKLSGSYDNAVIGNNQAIENGYVGAYIFDSKSASAGEALIAIKIRELIRAGMTREVIINTITRFINNMKTYLVLDSYDNLQKNGRLSKVKGSLIQMLNIKLIMGADGNGEIALFDKCRGTKQVIQQLLALIEGSKREPQCENLVISHCNNQSLAEQLNTLIKERFNFKRTYIVPTSGLSSMYADDKGIVLAF
jgi:DegV family protein with EDD domain